MKKLILLFSLFTSTTFAREVTLKDVAGSYDIFVPKMGINLIANISDEGHIDVDVYTALFVRCEGEKARIKNKIFISHPTCNFIPITLKVDLRKVNNFNKFMAPVFSSLVGRELEMEFTRR